MRRMLFAVLGAFLLVGCGGTVAYEGDLRTGAFSKVHGLATIEDVVKHSIDFQLEREQRGERPNAGAKSWPAYWQDCIATWRGHGDADAEAYYYRRRKELGLSRAHSS